MVARFASVGCRFTFLLSCTASLAAPPAADRRIEQRDSGEVAQGLCPGSGECCDANGSPGCNDASCCNFICNLSPFCCDIGWDQGCADLAAGLCSVEACPLRCPGVGDCCQSHDTPSCRDAACCELVCSQDSFCCDGVWSQACANLADILCPDLCVRAAPCPGEGDCCLTSDTVGCSNTACCETICAEDAFCCAVEWDSICADLAGRLCVPLCDGPCPAVGDCCSPHAGGGCEDAACCGAVCNADVNCCDGNWGPDCVTLADSLCSDICGGDCPGEGSCCETHVTSGCSDPTCCDIVCADSSFCCFLGWDFDCVRAAEDLCGDLCTNPPVCPSGGDCCVVGGAPGCDDVSCCERVCADDPTCCSGAWDSTCVAKAGALCGLSCQCSLFGDFDTNGVTNLADFAWFQRCFTGADGGPIDPACICGDAANNGDIDLIDFKAFLGTLRTP